PKKTTPAEIAFLDTPGLLPTERRDNPRRLAILRDAGGLLVVLTGFGDGDLAGELRRLRQEVPFADLEIITNRISPLETAAHKPKPAKEKEQDQHEMALLRRLAEALEQGRSAATLGLKDEEEKAVRSFQLLTLKPELVLVNAAEGRAGQSL